MNNWCFFIIYTLKVITVLVYLQRKKQVCITKRKNSALILLQLVLNISISRISTCISDKSIRKTSTSQIILYFITRSLFLSVTSFIDTILKSLVLSLWADPKFLCHQSMYSLYDTQRFFLVHVFINVVKKLMCWNIYKDAGSVDVLIKHVRLCVL